MEYYYHNQIKRCPANLNVGVFGISNTMENTKNFVWPGRCLINCDNMLII